MQTIVNLYYMKINSISGNGSVTIGDATHNSHTSNHKSQGINSSYGDTAPTEALMENVFIDPDGIDQTELGNTDATTTGIPLSVPLNGI